MSVLPIPHATDARGQTLQGFVIGMAVFLLVLAYVFAFLPSLLAPFAPDTDSTAARADRTADFLTRDALARNASAPGLLDATCTRKFFEQVADPPDDCRYNDTTTDVQQVTALPPQTDANVTMLRDGSLATYGGTELAAGPDPADASRVVRASRIVTLDGRDYRFVVRIW